MITAEQLAQAMLEMGRKMDKEIGESQKRIEASRIESDKRMEALRIESERKLNKVSKLVGNMSNSQGEVAEEFFYNSLKDDPSLAGINYDFIEANAHRKKDKTEDEYDILLVNGKDIAIIETKYKAHTKDVEKLINTKYKNFKKLYPEYKDYNHHLGLASFKMNEEVKNLALENNVMLLQRKGKIMKTILPNI